MTTMVVVAAQYLGSKSRNRYTTGTL